MTDFSRHVDTRNPLESLLRKIPGFKGYLEKEYRRESDQLARTLAVDYLQKCKLSLDEFQRSQVDAGRLDALSQCERIRSRLDRLQSQLKGAMRGYSGFFDFVQVDEGLLDQIYQHDLMLVDDAEGLATKFDQLVTTSDAAASFTDVQHRIEDIARQVADRTKLLEGLHDRS